MADTVTTQVLVNNTRNYVVKLTNLSDGTGESLVTKIAASSTFGVHAKLWTVDYDVSGMTVQMFWKGTPNQPIGVFAGYATKGIEAGRFGGIWNNASSPTGDVLLSTIGAAANSSYLLILEFRLGIQIGT
jgi:hypothetical protein